MAGAATTTSSAATKLAQKKGNKASADTAAKPIRMQMHAAKITKPKTQGQKFLAKARKAHREARVQRELNKEWAQKELKKVAAAGAATTTTTTATATMRPSPRSEGKIPLSQGPRTIWVPNFYA